MWYVIVGPLMVVICIAANVISKSLPKVERVAGIVSQVSACLLFGGLLIVLPAIKIGRWYFLVLVGLIVLGVVYALVLFGIAKIKEPFVRWWFEGASNPFPHRPRQLFVVVITGLVLWWIGVNLFDHTGPIDQLDLIVRHGTVAGRVTSAWDVTAASDEGGSGVQAVGKTLSVAYKIDDEEYKTDLGEHSTDDISVAIISGRGAARRLTQRLEADDGDLNDNDTDDTSAAESLLEDANGKLTEAVFVRLEYLPANPAVVRLANTGPRTIGDWLTRHSLWIGLLTCVAWLAWAVATFQAAPISASRRSSPLAPQSGPPSQ